MKLHDDPETDSLYIELRGEAGAETREITDGVRVDLNEKGEVVGFDIDRAASHLDLTTLEAVERPLKVTRNYRAASIARVWTAHWMQGLGVRRSDLVRLQSCVRPVLRGTLSAGPDGVRDPLPNAWAAFDGHRATRVLWIVGSTDQHLSSLALHLRHQRAFDRRRP